MRCIVPIEEWDKQALVGELLHFQEVASLILPREKQLPRFPNIDYHWGIEPLKGCVSGDHVIIVNFDEYNLREKIELAEREQDHALAQVLRKNLTRFGILIADASGHKITDSVNVNYLHAAFKTGVAYELKCKGEITADLIELINTQYFNRNDMEFIASKPYVTMIYIEIDNSGFSRNVNAGHPLPFVWSREFRKIQRLGEDRTQTSTPLGVIPSDFHADAEAFEPTRTTKSPYGVNEITLKSPGDIMLLYTDGLIEQEGFTIQHLEDILWEARDLSAKDVYYAICAGLCTHAATDDLTVVVVKKT